MIVEDLCPRPPERERIWNERRKLGLARASSSWGPRKFDASAVEQISAALGRRRSDPPRG
jgi:hypothetical protein